MSYLDSLDESWGRISGGDAQRLGIKLIYGYLSHDPGKNLTSANIADYHKHGIGVWPGWESTTGRPLEGAAAGHSDALAAHEQMRAHIRNLGYAPLNEISIPFSLDRDLGDSQFATALPYYVEAERVLHQLEHWHAGAYAKMRFLDYLWGKGFKVGLFGPYAWAGGYVSPHIGLYQYLNGQTAGGASVDYDHIVNAPVIGAWWPPGHPLDIPAVRSDSFDELMARIGAA